MKIYHLDDGNSILIEFKGNYNFIPYSEQYDSFLKNISYIYRNKIKDYGFPDIDIVLKLIESNNKLREYKFDLSKNSNLYCCISDFSGNTRFRRKIGRRYINELIKEIKNSNYYSFNGITGELYYKDYNWSASIISNYIVNSEFISFQEFLDNYRNFANKTSERIDHFLINYLIIYTLNTHPGKLDFLINE